MPQLLAAMLLAVASTGANAQNQNEYGKGAQPLVIIDDSSIFEDSLEKAINDSVAQGTPPSVLVLEGQVSKLTNSSSRTKSILRAVQSEKIPVYVCKGDLSYFDVKENKLPSFIRVVTSKKTKGEANEAYRFSRTIKSTCAQIGE